MALTYVRKLSRSELGEETLPCEGRVMKYGGIDKFHMQRNPWSSNLYAAKPSEFYNPIWTDISMDEYNPRLAEHLVSGDIEAWRHKMNEKERPQIVIPVEPRPYRSFYVPPPESSSSSSSSAPSTLSRIITEMEKKKEDEQEKEKKRKAKETPRYMFHARCGSKHVWPLLNYCFPCERALQYKLFTKTLQIKRANDEAKYRSKDPWEKRNLRRGTSPVHSYHPMQTCDDDYWPKQGKRQAKEKLSIYDRRKDALETKKKEEEEYLEAHPPSEKEEKKWVTTDITKTRPRHRKGTRNQGSKALTRVLPLKHTNPIKMVTPFATAVQKQAAAIIRAPQSHGIPSHEKEVYSLDHIHPNCDPTAKYYPPGDQAFTPLHHFSKFQGLHSPRWRNKELYKTKRPHCTRYEGIHDITRRADGTTYIHSQ